MSEVEKCVPCVYVVHHAPLPKPLENYLTPIRVSNYQDVPEGTLTDNTGDHIASKNKEYAELTALYWMWKNDKTSTHLGLWHYRRWLIPNSYVYNGVLSSGAMHKCSDWSDLEQFKVTQDMLVEACRQSDVILPYWEPVHGTIEKQFAGAVSQPLLDIVYRAFDKLYPNYPSLRHFLQSNKTSIFCSMAIMRRDLLDDYCHFLFPLLTEAAKDPYLEFHLSGLNLELRNLSHGLDPRWAGFWGERLLAYYAEYFWCNNPDIKVNYWRLFAFSKN